MKGTPGIVVPQIVDPGIMTRVVETFVVRPIKDPYGSCGEPLTEQLDLCSR